MRVNARAWIAAAMLAVSVQAGGATFGLTPMRVELSATTPTAIVSVNNSGDAPVTIQVQTYAWTQPAGDDVYEETRGFIVSPPIFTLAPGAAQVVRVALRGKPSTDIEQAYRLIFREVPPAEEAAADSALFHIALNMNIPMYVAPSAAPAAPKPAWSMADGPDGTPRLRVANIGTANLRLATLVISQGQNKLEERDVFVVLPGAARFIALPKDRLRSDAPLHVDAQSNAGRVDLVVPVAKP